MLFFDTSSSDIRTKTNKYPYTFNIFIIKLTFIVFYFGSRLDIEHKNKITERIYVNSEKLSPRLKIRK